jgi:hypothetical protein
VTKRSRAPFVGLEGANVRRVYEVHGDISDKVSTPDVLIAELAARALNEAQVQRLDAQTNPAQQEPLVFRA